MTDAKPDSAAALVAKLLARARNGSLRPSENARAFDALTNLRAAHFGLVLAALDIAEVAMDKLNGDTGTKSRPCSFCRAEVYNAEVGIEHSPARPELGDAGCPILVARQALATVAAAAKEARA